MLHRLSMLLTALSLFALVLFPQASKADQILKVGIVAPLTGPAAEYGIAIRNAIELKGEEDPKSEEAVHYIYEDAPYNARAAVDAFNRLKNVEHVDLIYVWGVVFCEALAPLAEQTKTPMVAQCVQQGVSRGRNYVIRFANPAPDYTNALWSYARKKAYKRIGLVLAENAYLQLIADSLTTAKRPEEEWESQPDNFRGLRL